ncbi:hypothetical protein U1Q18_007489, partial [Sarracenia purpurea var. burkii]
MFGVFLHSADRNRLQLQEQQPKNRFRRFLFDTGVTPDDDEIHNLLTGGYLLYRRNHVETTVLLLVLTGEPPPSDSNAVLRNNA